MKKFALILLSVLLLLSSCSNNKSTEDESVAENTATVTTDAAKEAEDATPKPTDEPEMTPEVFDVDSISEYSLNGLLINQDIPAERTQLIFVGVGQRDEKMYLMEKQENGMWQVVYGPFDVQIGKNGLGKEAEGDGKSPEGIYELGYAFGKDAPPVGTIWPWRTTEDGDIWIEDPNSVYYNTYVKEGSIEEPDWKQYSNLNIAAFARAVEIRYNPERVSGAGSAIFLHIWTSPKKGTNGCTAISRENIDTLVAWLDPAKNPVIAQLPYESIANGSLVYLSDYNYDIKADIKFATDDNILGEALEGYEANQIITQPDVAKALVTANDMLTQHGAKLIVYEAYRPIAAFEQLRDWINNVEDTTGKDDYYKDIDKIELKQDYLTYDSDRLYIRAQVVNVSLVDMSGEPIDMGGSYMVFDEYSSYICDGLSPEQIYNRELLRDIMIQAGFSPIENQWWKFEYNPYVYQGSYDEIIR